MPRSPSFSVGVLVDWLKEPYQNAVLSGIARSAREANASLFCFAGGVVDAPRRIGAQRNSVFDLVNPDQLAGLIVLSGTIGNHIGAAALGAYCARYRPLPIVSIAVPIPGCACIGVDNDSGLRDGIRHLVLQHGYRRIAFVRGPEQNAEAQRRFQIYREVLASCDIPFDPALVAPGDWEQRSGAEGIRLLFDERRAAPRAVVFANDNMAIGGYRALHDRHLRLPADVAVLSFDDIEEARFLSPPLTTVRQPLAEQGSRAFETLQRLWRGEAIPSAVLLPTELVVRRSCGCSEDTRGAGESFTLSNEAPGPRDWQVARAALEASLAAIGESEGIGIPPASLAQILAPGFLELPPGAEEVVAGLIQTMIDKEVSGTGKVTYLRRIAAALEAATLPWISRDSAAALRQARLWSNIRHAIDGAAERIQAMERLRAERFAHTLVESNDVLLTSFQLADVMSAMRDQMPALGIPRAVVSLWATGDGAVAKQARVALAYDEAGPGLPAGIIFEAVQLAPPGAGLDARRGDFVIEPLSTDAQQLGFVVLEMGGAPGLVYEALRDQLSSALIGVDLVNKLIVEASRRELAERERLTEEMEIAAHIQKAILPQTFAVAGLEIGATMIPASEVGGDYFDVRPFPGGGWLGIGDVAGHGLTAGLVMLMIQTIFATLSEGEATARPSALLVRLNTVLFDNVRERLKQSHHATLTLLRYTRDGQITFAGAHEDIVVWRAKAGRCERLTTPGTWVGMGADISRATSDSTTVLADGDILVLHTDGVSEARDAAGTMFGVEGVCGALERHHDLPAVELCDAILAATQAWQPRADDDRTLVVARYHAV